MSLKAILWVMEEAPVNNQGELAVLYALADRASDDGSAAWPSQEWIAHRARCTSRTVRNHLSSLESRGLIRKGDPKHVAHIRKDVRPIVWNLNLTMKMSEERPENNDRKVLPGGKSGSNDRKVTTQRPESYDTTTGKSFPTNRPEPSVNRPEPSGAASRISEDFYPKNFDALAEKHPNLDLDSVLDEFKTYWLSNTTAKAKKKDWDRTFTVWCSRQKPKRMTREQKLDQMAGWRTTTPSQVLDEEAPF